MQVKIIFIDETTIIAELNGSTYITEDRPIFPEDLSTVTIKSDSQIQILHNVEIVECASIDDRFWFGLHEKTIQQLENEHIRNIVSETTQVTNIAFVKLAETGVIDEVTAGEHLSVFSPWEPDVDYILGNLRVYPAEGDRKLYKCIQAHRSQADWTPDKAVSLWSTASDPAIEWPEWSQPIGAQDAYMAGDKVSHNDKHWISDVDNNVWEPGIYGWTEN